MARARLLELHVDEQRPGRERRAHRVDLEPQFRGSPGPGREDPPGWPRHGCGGGRHRSFSGRTPVGVSHVQSGGQPPLRRIHETVYEQDPNARKSLEYHWTKPTDEIVKSLRPVPGGSEHLIVKPDGRIVQGNTRIKMLQERGYAVDDLPREIFE